MNSKVLLALFAFVLGTSTPLHAAVAGKVDPDEVISVDFPNEELLVVLRNVADLYELNLVVPSALKGERTSMKLRNVTWREIFNVGLRGTGYTWYSKGNIVWIVEIGDPSEEMAFIREKLENASDDNVRLRKALTILLKNDAPAITPEKRAKLLGTLSDPNRPASEILATLYTK